MYWKSGTLDRAIRLDDSMLIYTYRAEWNFHTRERINTMNSGKIILSALAGAAAGAALGILFAPEKGSATRKTISHKTGEYADLLKGKIDTAGDRVNQRIDYFQDKAIDWLERRKEKLNTRVPEAHKGNNI